MGTRRALYVGSSLTHEILKFDGTTGAFLGDFVSAGSGVEYPAVEGLVWHDNVLYVLCRDSARFLSSTPTAIVWASLFLREAVDSSSQRHGPRT